MIAAGDASHERLRDARRPARSATGRGREHADPPRPAADPPPPPPLGGPARRRPPRRARRSRSCGSGTSRLPRGTPDYHALLVLNMVLGGQFVSRINMNLREDKGYTYGARTGFDLRRGPGPFVLQASVQSDATADAIREAIGELRAIRGERPVTARGARARTRRAHARLSAQLRDRRAGRPRRPRSWRSTTCPTTTSRPSCRGCWRSRRTTSPRAAATHLASRAAAAPSIVGDRDTHRRLARHRLELGERVSRGGAGWREGRPVSQPRRARRAALRRRAGSRAARRARHRPRPRLRAQSSRSLAAPRHRARAHPAAAHLGRATSPARSSKPAAARWQPGRA